MNFRAAFRILGATAALVLVQVLITNAAVAPGAEYVPDQILIKFRPGASARAIRTITTSLRAEHVRTFQRFGIQLLRVPKGTVESAVERYRKDPAVEYVEPNYIWHLSGIPNDPHFTALWGMQNTGQAGGTPGADIRAPLAWSVFTGSASVKVAIIDSGLDYTHPDLAPNVWTNPGEIPNGLDDDGNGYIDDIHGVDLVNLEGDPMDDNGHGTHVAGTIAAVGNNAVGVAGVCWSASLVAIKAFGSDGTATTAATIEGVHYAVATGVRVINASWGGGPFSLPLYNAIKAAGNAGIVFVAAAGNLSVDTDSVLPWYPSSYDLPSIVSVAATDPNDSLATFSNWGATSVDIAAPGDRILSTYPGGSYAALSGTSMATPHVAGTLALLWGRFPGMSVAEAKDRLLSRAHPVPSLSGRVLTGGRLDAFAVISDPDTIPPGSISDLTVSEVRSDRVTLTWTAPGDDGVTGTAFSYDLRYSSAPIDAGNFASAAPARDVPSPAPAGTPQQTVVRGLGYSQTWYFAMRARDESDNTSAVSNLASASTPGPPDISVPLDSLTASLVVGQSVTRTLHVTNLGVSTLTLDAAAEELPGLAMVVTSVASSAPVRVLGRGRPVPLSDIPPDASIARQVEIGAPGGPAPGESAVDKDANVSRRTGPVSGSESFVQSANHEVFGGTDVTQVAGPRTRGNIFQCTAERLLREHRLYLAPGAGTQLWFQVYEGTAPSGNFTLISASRVDPVGTTEGWYSSGLVNVPLIPGRYYVLAATWDQPSAYSFRIFNYPYPIPTSFGHLTGGAGWLWSPTAILPPSPLITVPSRAYNDFDAVAYFQTLLTDDVERWMRLQVAPATAELLPGQSQDLSVTFDTHGMYGGDYLARIALASNDPDEPVVYVGAHFHVTGTPDIAVSPSTLHFDTLLAGGTRVDSVIVLNPGTDVLTIGGVDVMTSGFSAPAGGFRVDPGQKRTLPVTFHPLVSGEYTGQLVVHCDDPDQPEIVVALHGTAVPAPDIGVSPQALHADLGTGATRTTSLVVSNTGTVPLDFHVRVRARDTSAAMASVGGLAMTRRWDLGMAPERPGNGPAASRQAVRVQYGEAVASDRILVYSDDWGAVGRQPVDLALQQLGLPYTAVYRDPATFGAMLTGSSWDLVIVDHLEYYELGQWWSELETHFNAGGRLLITTFDVDGSSSEPTTLWQTIGLKPAGDIRWTVPTMAWWPPSHALFNDPESLPNLKTFSWLASVQDVGDSLEVLPGATSPGGWAPSFMKRACSIVISHDERAIVNGFVRGKSIYQDDDEDGRLDQLELLTNEIAFLASSLPWLSVRPRAGTVPPGGQITLDVGFDAHGLQGGSYLADLIVASIDPDESEIRIPTRLDVTGQPDIALLGPERHASSTIAYHERSAVTRHALPITGATAGGATFKLKVDGNYRYEHMMATAYVEGGLVLGSISDTQHLYCTPDSATFVIDPLRLKSLSADGVLNVTVINTWDVDTTTCPLNRHTVALEWWSAIDSLDLGVGFTGFCRYESLAVFNQGTAPLVVSSLSTSDPSFIVSSSSPEIAPMDTGFVVVGFCPTATGEQVATLFMQSNDPDTGTLNVHLHGVGAPAPDVAVGEDSLYAEMGPHEIVNRRITIDNMGAGPLLWRARAVDVSVGGTTLVAQSSTGRSRSLSRGAGTPARIGAGGLLPPVRPQPVTLLAPDPVTASLEHVRNALDRTHTLVTGLVPARYDFSEGDSGATIADGGANMYDGGNQITVPPKAGYLPYTNGTITSHPLVGTSGRYFTRKYPGLFVLAADLDGVSAFGIDGELGANGMGTAIGTGFTFSALGRPFRAFVKRVYGAPTPSVNHLIIVPDTPGLTYQVSNDTNSDHHSVSGMPGGRLYYLLFASAAGGYVDDARMLAIAQRFMDVVGSVSQALELSPISGEVAPGASAQLDVSFHTAGLLSGTYDTQIVLESNDPDEGVIMVTTRIHLLAIPDAAVSPAEVDFGEQIVGVPRADSVTIANIGSDALAVTGLEASPGEFTVDGSGFVLAPGTSRTVPVTFLPTVEGALTGALVVHSNDADHPDLTIPLGGTGLVAPDIALGHDSLYSAQDPNQRVERTLSFSNQGGSTLDWSAGTEFTIAPAGAAAARRAAMPRYAGERRPGADVSVPSGAALQAIVNARIAALPPNSIVFRDDMEHGPQAWSTVTTAEDDLWHLTTSASSSANHSWWCGVEGAGNYATGHAIRNALVSPPIDLTVVTPPVSLQFAESYATEPGFDECGVWVSTDDGATWQLVRWPASGSSGGWQLTTLDLTSYAGQVIRIRFHFQVRDGLNNNYPGWFVDDVLVQSNEPPWLAVTPAAGTLPAGANTDLQVSVSSVGLPPGSYDASLTLITNDPDEGIVPVPVRMDIMDPTVDVPLATGEFALAAVRPNVAKGQAIVEFELTRGGRAQAAIYDIAGRRIQVIAERDFAAGRHRFTWRGEGEGGRVPAGVYLLRLVAPEGRRTRRFVWMP